MVSEKERENREKLFRLVRENPELPVVAMVDSEIVADDGYNRWLGVWGCSYIGEYLIGEEHLFFREDDDPSEVDRVLSERYGDDYYADMTGKRKRCEVRRRRRQNPYRQRPSHMDAQSHPGGRTRFMRKRMGNA